MALHILLDMCNIINQFKEGLGNIFNRVQRIHLKTTLMKVLEQTWSATGKFHHKKNSSQQEVSCSWTGLDALSRRCNALLYHQVEKVILLSSQKRPGGRTNTSSIQTFSIDKQWRMCWSHVMTWGGHECLCSLTTALSEETSGTLCLSPGRPSAKQICCYEQHP